jgi:hypothetical protein
MSICEEILSGNWQNIAANFESVLAERAKHENIRIIPDPNSLNALLDTALFDAVFRKTPNPKKFWRSFFLNPRE